MFKSIFALFKGKKNKKSNIQPVVTVPKKNASSPRRGSYMDRRTTDSSDDLLHPLNPLSPLSPISPISIYNDIDSEKKESEDSSRKYRNDESISPAYSNVEVDEKRTRSNDSWGSDSSHHISPSESYSSSSSSGGGDSGGGGSD